MAGWLRTERDEPVLSVRITDRCPHDPSTYERMDCGHGFCKVCDGFVCCETQAVCRGVGPVIKCNRMHHKLSEYPFLFAEIFARSGRLTEEMRRVLPRGKVKAPSDIKHGPFHDIIQKPVYERLKKEIKSRETFYMHFAPRCSDFSYAQRKYMERSRGAPYGVGERDKVMESNVIAVRTVNLCIIKHSIGDAFSIICCLNSSAQRACWPCQEFSC